MKFGLSGRGRLSKMKDRVIGRIILRGLLENTSPFLIGNGEGDQIDIRIIKNSEGKAYIPATSFAGAVRHHMEKFISKDNKIFEYVFGSENNGVYQSHLVVDDLISDNAVISFRDGVAIDNEKNIVKTDEKEHGMKYDYEIVEPGAEFKVNLETTIREGADKEGTIRLLRTIVAELEKENIQIGGKTTSGFGKLKLHDARIIEFDFTNRDHVSAWLNNDFGSIQTVDLSTIEPFSREETDLIIEATFSLNSSLIVGLSTGDPGAPDKVNMKSGGKNVIPGTSIKGAIRHRAEKIINTLSNDPECCEAIINGLFGYVDEKSKSRMKGRVIVDECYPKNVEELVQNRIKIDRFTSGTITNALFNSAPLWESKGNSRLEVRSVVNDFNDHEAGLMLFVLKDLWNGDLAIGGEKAVGRGCVRGIRAVIHAGSEKFELIQEGTGIKITGNAGKLEEYALALTEKCTGDDNNA